MQYFTLDNLTGFTLHSWQFFLVSLTVLGYASYFGASALARLRTSETKANEDVRMIVGATLTLLGLIISFTLSMAIGGYNARQVNEAAEAVAISTAFSRAELLPSGQATTIRPLLAQYLDDRLRFYRTHDSAQLRLLAEETNLLKQEVWTNVVLDSRSQPTPLAALAVSGINDVLTSETNTRAGWRTQIPLAAWALMAVIAICCNLLMGFCAGSRKRTALLIVLPLVISISFTLISDIDVPGRGVIRVSPVNLERIASTLQAANSHD
ncbi:hypothetical protein SAMN05443245_4195 [Paraburkholderia fungorum]|uniref:DUF4239 domain-containing protein n=1 Tax=Paraburkholderia fungorum TaxID=134537 RepID=A0A1H1HQW9_9BURK|nr:hypothetical protein [Paraburkholderia fungorum]SDR27871.1 hypothetical protein SAMN05443245_4195 [Paraburkholderia fungorum]